jgi:hypothetical protein
MSKVYPLVINRTFPKKHSKPGEPTYFVEKFLNVVAPEWKQAEFAYPSNWYLVKLQTLNAEALRNRQLSPQDIFDFFCSLRRSINVEKTHCVKRQTKFQVGDFFTPVVWSGKDQNSVPIKIWDDCTIYSINDLEYYSCNFWYKEKMLQDPDIDLVAKNDGLSTSDFMDYFEFYDCSNTDTIAQVIHFTKYTYL